MPLDFSKKTPLRESAVEVIRLLEQLREDTAEAPHLVQIFTRFQRRFATWVDEVDAFSGDDNSLENRLCSYENLLDFVFRLLERLFQSLLRCSEMSNSLNEEDGSLKPIEKTPKDLRMRWDMTLDVIDSTIFDLNVVRVVIHEYTAQHRERKPSCIAGVNLKPFADLCATAVRIMYPGALQYIHDKLANSMVQRYERILAVTSRNNLAEVAANSSPNRNADDRIEDCDSSMHQATAAVDRSDSTSSTGKPIPCSSSLALNNSSHDEMVAKGDGVRPYSVFQAWYPRQPTKKDCEEVECQWCLQTLGHHPLEDIDWRKHVDQDLKPYICLLDQCSGAHSAHSTITQWLAHMEKHQRRWYKRLPLKPYWKCCFCEPNPNVFIDSNALYSHMEHLHSIEFTHRQLKTIAQEYTITPWRQWNYCFLCCSTVKTARSIPTSGLTRKRKSSISEHGTSKIARRSKHIASPIHRNSGFTSTDNTSNSDDNNPDHLCDGGGIDRAQIMTDHIAEHLRSLMMLSLRLIDLQRDSSGDCVDDSSDSVHLDTGSDQCEGEVLYTISEVGCTSGMDSQPHKKHDFDECHASASECCPWEYERPVPDSDVDLRHVPRHCDSTPPGEDPVLRQIIESGAFQAWEGHMKDCIDQDGSLSTTRKTLSHHQLPHGDAKILQSTVNHSQSPRPHVTCLQLEARKQIKVILDWLAADNFTIDHAFVSKSRNIDSCNWFTASKEFLAWVAGRGRVLFCPGRSGAGKTVLASAIIDNLRSRFGNDPNVGISYVYCTNQNLEHYIRDIFLMLIRQLAETQFHLPRSFISLYTQYRHKRSQMSLSTVAEALQNLIQMYPKVYIVVDGLDECNDEHRNAFLGTIFLLRKNVAFNLLVASSVLPDIIDYLGGFPTRYIFSADPGDLDNYLDARIAELPLGGADRSNLSEMIKTMIQEASDGIFLLAKTYADYLSLQASREGLLAALTELNDESTKRLDRRGKLHSTYEKIFKASRILGNSPCDIEAILSWVISARRPLTSLELQHALAVQTGTKETDPDKIPTVEDMIRASGFLIAVKPGSNEVCLTHSTVREYFESCEKSSMYQCADTFITKACATYLAYDAFNSVPCSTDAEFEARLQNNPLLKYAACYWGQHARGLPVCEEVTALLSRHQTRQSSVQALMATKSPKTDSYSQDFPSDMTSLHLAAYFGATNIAREFLAMENLNCADGKGRSPLSYAAEEGHTDIVKILLGQESIDINMRGEDGKAAISWAAKNGHEEIVRLLLAVDGIDKEPRDKSGRRPIFWAVEGGHLSVVQLIINSSLIDIYEKDYDWCSALDLAEETRDETMTKLLIEETLDHEAREIACSRGDTELAF